MVDNENTRLRKAILEVIANQIQENEPPETKITLDRLQAEGFSENEALKLIGYIVAHEVFSVLKKDRSYDEKRYVEALRSLPRLPWDIH